MKKEFSMKNTQIDQDVSALQQTVKSLQKEVAYLHAKNREIEYINSRLLTANWTNHEPNRDDKMTAIYQQQVSQSLEQTITYH